METKGLQSIDLVNDVLKNSPFKRKSEGNDCQPPPQKVIRGWVRRSNRLIRSEDDNEDKDDNLKRLESQIRDKILYEYGCASKDEMNFTEDIFSSARSPLKKDAEIELSNDTKEKKNYSPINNSRSRIPNESTRQLIELISNNETLVKQIRHMYLDTRIRSLKKVDTSRVAMGELVLDAIEDALDEQNYSKALSHSTNFYKTIKHDYGFLPPPTITNKYMVAQKKRVLMSLNSILTTDMIKSMSQDPENPKVEMAEEFYKNLDCKITLLKSTSKVFKIIDTYAKASCKSNDPNYKLMKAWKVDSTADKRFEVFNAIKHRKLLWTPTHAASIAATLKEGHRLPTYKGDLGKGLHFHSNFLEAVNTGEHDYTKEKDGAHVIYMFLSEVVLGRSKIYLAPEPNLLSPPTGYASVVGEGQKEPRPKMNASLFLDGKWALVPLGTPTLRKKFKGSKFKHSKYVVYQESQAKLRYLLKFNVY